MMMVVEPRKRHVILASLFADSNDQKRAVTKVAVPTCIPNINS